MGHEHLGANDHRILQFHGVEMLLHSLGRSAIPLDAALAEQFPGTQGDVDQWRRFVDGLGNDQGLVHPAPRARPFGHEDAMAQSLNHDLVFTAQLVDVAHRRFSEGACADQALSFAFEGHECGGWHGGAPFYLGCGAGK
ncbi:hypothetical protein D3C85_1490300 [compost metagenome]